MNRDSRIIKGVYQLKRYQVNKIACELKLTGCGADALWNNAFVLSDFCYPWEFIQGLPQQDNAMRFRALWSQTQLYFLFEVADETLLSKQQLLKQQAVIDCDRVELFFKKDHAMHPYYPIEIDPLGRVLDARANYYRQLDFQWGWPQHALQLKTNIDARGYCVEGSISLAFLGELGLYQRNHPLQVGLYRARYSRDQNANHQAVHWISWLIPETQTPDFHIPSSFGEFELLN